MKLNTKLVTFTVLTILFTSLMIGSVFAGFPGRNGRIAFVRGERGGDSEIWSINPDGTDERQLTFNGNVNAQPAWSPDGSKIAFIRFVRDQTNVTIWVMNADGSDQTPLTTEAQGDSSTPGWAPNGSLIIFTRYTEAEGDRDIWVMDADGSNQHVLLDTDTDVSSPAWAPNGTLIAFVGMPPTGGPPQIWVMNADGTNPTMLTDTDANLHPDWHPSSMGIVFTRHYADDGGGSDIWAISADGSFEELVVDIDDIDAHPACSPDGTSIVFGSGARENGGPWDLLVWNEAQELSDLTDVLEDSWCPDWQPLLGVGGDIIPINRLQVLVPYLAIAVITIGTIGLLRKKHIP